MQTEGRADGPSGTHLADSLKALYLANFSHSLLREGGRERGSEAGRERRREREEWRN